MGNDLPTLWESKRPVHNGWSTWMIHANRIPSESKVQGLVKIGFPVFFSLKNQNGTVWV